MKRQRNEGTKANERNGERQGMREKGAKRKHDETWHEHFAQKNGRMRTEADAESCPHDVVHFAYAL